MNYDELRWTRTKNKETKWQEDNQTERLGLDHKKTERQKGRKIKDDKQDSEDIQAISNELLRKKWGKKKVAKSAIKREGGGRVWRLRAKVMKNDHFFQSLPKMILFWTFGGTIFYTLHAVCEKPRKVKSI